MWTETWPTEVDALAVGAERVKERRLMMEEASCPDCGEVMDYFDTTYREGTGIPYCCLVICHNEGCKKYGTIHNNLHEQWEHGDPSGLY